MRLMLMLYFKFTIYGKLRFVTEALNRLSFGVTSLSVRLCAGWRSEPVFCQRFSRSVSSRILDHAGRCLHIYIVHLMRRVAVALVDALFLFTQKMLQLVDGRRFWYVRNSSGCPAAGGEQFIRLNLFIMVKWINSLSCLCKALHWALWLAVKRYRNVSLCDAWRSRNLVRL